MNKKQLLKRIVKSIGYGVVGGFLLCIIITIKCSLEPWCELTQMIIIGPIVLISAGLFGLFVEIIRIVFDLFINKNKVFSVFARFIFISGVILATLIVFFLFIVDNISGCIKGIVSFCVIGGFLGAFLGFLLTKLNK